MTEERRGELYTICESMLWALVPVVALITFRAIPPITLAGISTLLAGLFFVIWVTWRREWRYIYNSVWKEIILSTVFVGVLFYGILFVGISYTTAGNTAILGLSQIFFAFLFINVLLRLEKNTTQQYVGAVCMACGAILVLVPKGSVGLDVGAFLVVLAMAIAPIGNWFAKQATQQVSPHFVMMVRSALAGTFLFCVGFFVEQPHIFFDTKTISLILFNGIVLFGVSKVLWLESIKRISIAKATALSAVEPFFTVGYAFFLLAEVPTTTQVIAIVPLLVGAYLITYSRT